MIKGVVTLCIKTVCVEQKLNWLLSEYIVFKNEIFGQIIDKSLT